MEAHCSLKAITADFLFSNNLMNRASIEVEIIFWRKPKNQRKQIISVHAGKLGEKNVGKL